MIAFLFYHLQKIIASILVLLLTLMIIDVSWQVFTRFLTEKPSSHTEEIARFLLIWISMLGASYAHAQRAHLGIDLLINALKGRQQRLVIIVSHLATFIFAACVMVYGGSYLVLLTINLDQVSASVGVSMAYVYVAIPVSGFAICINCIYFMLPEFRNTSPAHSSNATIEE